MYALKEWGYEHPSKTLFDTVSEIVAKKHKLTNKPVPFEVVVAELGKYRLYVNSASLIIALSANPTIQKLSTNSFIPKLMTGEEQKDVSLDELDTILEKFENNL